MNQDNLDDKIKDIFGSLDEQDLAAAQESKEDVWSMVQVKREEKKTNHWWLWVLLGGLLFAAGWFLKPQQVKESAPPYEETPEQPSIDPDLRFALNRAESSLKSQQKSLDSLQVLNASLSDRLLSVSQNDIPLAVHERIVRDTIFLTEVKVEQRIIEKLIRDTIIVEVPHISATAAIADVGKNMPEVTIVEQTKTNISAHPQSVQFNFSETKQRDK